MKKQLIKSQYKMYLLIIILIIVTLSITSYIIIKEKQHKPLLFMNCPAHYSLVVEDDNPYLYIDIYASVYNSSYLNKDSILNAYLSSQNNEDIYQLKIEETSCINKKVKYKEKTYYLHTLKCKIPYLTNTISNLENAHLELNYVNNQSILFKVGNLSITNNSYQQFLKIRKIKGIINDIAQNNTLVGVIVEMHNETSDKITINDLKLLSPIIKINYEYIKKIPLDNYDHDIDIKDIVGKDYLINEESFTKLKPIEINAYETITLVIPFTYSQNIFIDQVGIIIQGDYNTQIIAPISLFKTTKKVDNAIVQTIIRD